MIWIFTKFTKNHLIVSVYSHTAKKRIMKELLKVRMKINNIDIL
jgi:hypothetical protein